MFSIQELNHLVKGYFRYVCTFTAFFVSSGMDYLERYVYHICRTFSFTALDIDGATHHINKSFGYGHSQSCSHRLRYS